MGVRNPGIKNHSIDLKNQLLVHTPTVFIHERVCKKVRREKVMETDCLLAGNQSYLLPKPSEKSFEESMSLLRLNLYLLPTLNHFLARGRNQVHLFC